MTHRHRQNIYRRTGRLSVSEPEVPVIASWADLKLRCVKAKRCENGAKRVGRGPDESCC
jgi:hypothetical protein